MYLHKEHLETDGVLPQIGQYQLLLTIFLKHIFLNFSLSKHEKLDVMLVTIWN